jgi:ribosome-binding factor A
MTHRSTRVNELIKSELGIILAREITIPGVLITIIDVETSLDIRHAKVSLSIFPEKKAGSTLTFLAKEIYGMQKTLNKRLLMKPVPKIRFIIDKSGELFTKTNQAINGDTS